MGTEFKSGDITYQVFGGRMVAIDWPVKKICLICSEEKESCCEYCSSEICKQCDEYCADCKNYNLF